MADFDIVGRLVVELWLWNNSEKDAPNPSLILPFASICLGTQQADARKFHHNLKRQLACQMTLRGQFSASGRPHPKGKSAALTSPPPSAFMPAPPVHSPGHQRIRPKLVTDSVYVGCEQGTHAQPLFSEGDLDNTQADSSRWTRRRFCCGGAASSSRITWRTASIIERCWINATSASLIRV